jgi:hypothetical protein
MSYNVLLDFIKTHKNTWIEDLAQDPYYVTAKRCNFTDDAGNLLYPELYMLSYNTLACNFSDPLVRVCRGCIVSVEDINSPKMVCTPFYKFGNWGESYVDDLDWDSVTVLDKVDGSLMKCFNYKNNWIWVTNNGWNINHEVPVCIISSFTEKETDGMTTFEQLKDYAWNKITNNASLESLDKNLTYMFELISPKNRVICDHPLTKLVLLGARDINTYQEILPEDLRDRFDVLRNFEIPEVFNLTTIDEVLTLCNSYKDSFHEGVVIRDKNFHRAKIKCKHYMQLKGFKGEIGFTNQKVLDAINAGTVDDVIGCFPEIKPQVLHIIEIQRAVTNHIRKKCQFAKEKYNEIAQNESDLKIIKKEFSAWIYSNYKTYSTYFFACIKGDEYLENILCSFNWQKISDLYDELLNNGETDVL